MMARKKASQARPSFVKIWHLVKNNRNALALMFFLDAAFILALLFFRKFVELIAPAMGLEALLSSSALALYGLFLFALYYLLVLLLYSLVKFFVLHFLQNMLSPREVQVERFFPFYWLNVMLTLVFLALALGGGYVLNAAKQPYDIIVFIVLAIPYLFLLFVVLHASHSIFYARQLSAWQSLLQGFRFVVSGRYGFVCGWIAVMLLLLVGVLLIPGFLIRGVADSNPVLYRTLYNGFSTFTSIIGIVASYVILVLSRISFYMRVHDASSA
jgi:hypothetical protein